MPAVTAIPSEEAEEFVALKYKKVLPVNICFRLLSLTSHLPCWCLRVLRQKMHCDADVFIETADTERGKYKI